MKKELIRPFLINILFFSLLNISPGYSENQVVIYCEEDPTSSEGSLFTISLPTLFMNQTRIPHSKDWFPFQSFCASYDPQTGIYYQLGSSGSSKSLLAITLNTLSTQIIPLPPNVDPIALSLYEDQLIFYSASIDGSSSSFVHIMDLQTFKIIKSFDIDGKFEGVTPCVSTVTSSGTFVLSSSGNGEENLLFIDLSSGNFSISPFGPLHFIVNLQYYAPADELLWFDLGNSLNLFNYHDSTNNQFASFPGFTRPSLGDLEGTLYVNLGAIGGSFVLQYYDFSSQSNQNFPVKVPFGPFCSLQILPQ